MSSRRRLGVVLLLEGAAAVEVGGLRRALGAGAPEVVGPHVTLVPPVNVRREDMAPALALLRSAAAACPGPLTLDIGPVATFAPLSPVAYLAVGGDGLEPLVSLHDLLWRAPFERPGRWPYVPHVTLCEEATPPRLAAAVEAMASYRSSVTFERVVMLEQVGRQWSELADAWTGPPVVAGRGGLEAEIWQGRVYGPELAAAVGPAPEGLVLAPGHQRLVLTALSRGRCLGGAAAWVGGQAGAPVEAWVCVAPGERGLGLGRALLARLEEAVGRAAWDGGTAVAHGPTGFYAACGRWAQAGPEALGPATTRVGKTS